MTDPDQAVHAGNTLFEAFVEQVKQVLEHLYDFAYLQQHPLARIYDQEGDLSAKTAGRRLRQDLLTIIEAMKPQSGTHFRESAARLYHILHLYYVENMTIHEAALELGLSERQAYRDLRRGQEAVAAHLWDKRLPSAETESAPASDFSFDSEIARLKVDFSAVDFGALVRQASAAVERLAQGRGVEMRIHAPREPISLSTDSGIAHQVIVSLLSYAVQQALPGNLAITLSPDRYHLLTLDFAAHAHNSETTSVIAKLAERIHWQMDFSIQPDQMAQITVQTASEKTTILIIDDNEGWIELVGRFLEGYDCAVVTLNDNQDALQQVQDLHPAVIILDVMMPKRDGWELLQRLRAQPTTAAIPVVVCSVFNDPQLAYSLGASAFVAKPANRETILDSLKQLGAI